MRVIKRTGLVVAAVLMGLMSMAPANAAPIVNQAVGLGDSAAQSEPPFFFGRYIIRNASGKCLEIENSSIFNGDRAQQWDCVGQPGMYWRIGTNGTGALSIVNWRSSGCLEIENSSYSNGARAQQWTCVGQPGANWSVDENHIINASGKCLEIENSSYSNGARAQQWDCVGQRGANWTFEYVG